MAPTIPREQMAALFQPRSVAFIGASESSGFFRISWDLVERFGARARTHLINPRTANVFGQPAYERCVDVPGGVDCAYIMVHRGMVAQAVEDAAAAGARSAVVLSAGYAETGPEGARAQDALVAQCREAGITLLGPNMLGFANVAAGVAAGALPGIQPRRGQVALVSQSGAGAGSLTRFAATHGIALSFAVTTGNEAMVTAEDVLDYLIDDDDTRAIAVFAETLRQPALFREVARRAAAARRALVILKVGSSDLSARTALAHTGALVGDDAVIDAVFRQDAVLRVDHLEELLHTANLAAATGPWRSPGVGVVSLSGGACDVVADRAEEVGLPLPALSARTEQDLAAVVSDLGHVQNPLDVTGAGMSDLSLLPRAAEIVASDPRVGFVAVIGGRPTPAPMPAIAKALQSAGAPGAYVATVDSALDEETAQVLAECELLYLPSIRDAMTAMARVSWWGRRLTELDHQSADASGDLTASSSDPTASSGDLTATTRTVVAGSPLSEAEVRDLLRSAGVPVVPADFVSTRAQAVEAAVRFGVPVALKAVSRDLAHKSDVGGVRLDLRDATQVGEAYDAIFDGIAVAAPAAHVDGILVSPMRTGGIELIVGVTHHPGWGHVLAVGLGGVLVEVIRDTVLLPLPAGDDEIRRALHSLRAAPLLRGTRGRPPVDLPSLVTAIRAIADLATALGDSIDTLEINPLLVGRDVVEALDGLLTWRGGSGSPRS
ncbi:Acyl-CoA synthetase (NDP forming) [Parafrankia irregularis]|uniref:Acyl-CoA synthetase (NDP forming) n=1 Tax=Parafrankia irregularis TaxID=795642 RepID=A0A0S4QII6_9ACTN|nr:MULTISPECIES: acetate--CoA ligase family protein [Parafrankia]MBE3204070.1 acetate--CoA ligase family protein [Parafrankia sp. CH37]CUU55054.1 Acyl-CoA synthetase (NDP forming) [Parafrankia irregularis]